MPQRTTDYANRNGTEPIRLASTEVKPKARWRTFTAEYKLAILTEADCCQEAGEIGVLLRRKGIYSSNLTSWRRQRDAGELVPGAVRKRGRKADPKAAKVAKLRRENERLRAQLEQAELIIAAKKKSPAAGRCKTCPYILRGYVCGERRGVSEKSHPRGARVRGMKHYDYT